MEQITKANPQYRICQMSESDKQEVISWEEKYCDLPEFEGIKTYILEGDTYHGLKEVVHVNYEIFQIGDDEKQFSFVAKNENDEVVAWLLCDVFDISTKQPELFAQYIVTHPMHQHEGAGSEIAKEIFLNPEKYVGVKPVNYFAYVNKTNAPSILLLNKFGFRFDPMTEEYFRASCKAPKLASEHTTKPQEPGE